MADTFLLEVATPERLLVNEQVREAQIPAANGYLGILPGHAALLAELGAGELSYAVEGRRRALKIDGGWVEVAGRPRAGAGQHGRKKRGVKRGGANAVNVAALHFRPPIGNCGCENIACRIHPRAERLEVRVNPFELESLSHSRK